MLLLLLLLILVLSGAQHSRGGAECFIGRLAEEAAVGVLGWHGQVILMLEELEGLRLGPHILQLDLLVVMCPEEGPFEHQGLSSGLILDGGLHGCAQARRRSRLIV